MDRDDFAAYWNWRVMIHIVLSAAGLTQEQYDKIIEKDAYNAIGKIMFEMWIAKLSAEGAATSLIEYLKTEKLWPESL